MATKKLIKKVSKKNFNQQLQNRLPGLEFMELMQCAVMAYENIEGNPMLIYMRLLDRTINASWVHPKADLKSLKSILRRQERTKDYSPSWIGLWQESSDKLSDNRVLFQTVVGLIEKYRPNAINILFNPKLNPLPLLDCYQNYDGEKDGEDLT
jgi:hypothetical protein